MPDTRPTVRDCYRAIAHADMADQAWLVTEDRTVSFGELKTRIELMAALLARHGIGVGQRIVIASRDDAEVALLFVALICNGITVINLDPDTGQERAASLIAKADPCLLLLDTALARHWHQTATERALIELAPPSPTGLLAKIFGQQTASAGLHEQLSKLEPMAPDAAIPPETLAYILFTSGTTHEPKGVCISHRALFAHLATLHRRLQYRPGSRILNTLMLSHADGIIQGPFMGFYSLATVLRPLRFEVTRIEPLLDAVYQLRITHMVAVPTMLAIMLRLGLEQRDAFSGGDFRLLISCGAQLDKQLWEDFIAVFQVPLVNVYGLTETVIGGVFAGPDMETGIAGSIGKPEDCELCVAAADGSPVAAGASGELCMRGELLMSGYFAEPALTAAVMHEGWFHTGDIARCDEAGRYWITGRSKNIIIRGGYNIHPEEVTEVLDRHPGVHEAVTFGFADPVWGETVAALVAAESGVTVEALLAYCAAHMESRKVPSRLQLVAALPRGRSGKVMLEQARAMLEPTSYADPGPSQNDIDTRLLRVAAACFKISPDQINLYATPKDVPGWDSLAHMELIVALESEFGVVFSAQQIMALDSLEKALPLLTKS